MGRAALRSHGAAGPFCRAAHQRAGHAFQALSHRHGVARRTSAGRPLPRVHAVRLRYDRHPLDGLRHRDGPGDPRPAPRDRHPRFHHPPEQPHAAHRAAGAAGPGRAIGLGASRPGQARQDRAGEGCRRDGRHGRHHARAGPRGAQAGRDQRRERRSSSPGRALGGRQRHRGGGRGQAPRDARRAGRRRRGRTAA